MQAFEEESILFEKEKEERRKIEEEIVGQANNDVDVENVNLKKEIDILRREKEEAVRLGKELASLVESQEEEFKRRIGKILWIWKARIEGTKLLRKR